MAQPLQVLKATRDISLKRLQEISDVANEALSDEKKHTIFKLRFERLNLVFGDFEESHSKVISLLASDSTALTQEDAYRSTADSLYFNISTIYHDLFKQSLNNPGGSTQINQTSASANNSSNIRLPKIQLPSFDGNFKAWPNFHGLFKTLVHENKELSNLEKFQYLSTNLSKEPLCIVQGVPLSADNYEIAYNALEKRYENKRQLATFYWSEIRDAPKDCKSTDSLRKLLNLFTENIAALKSLQLPVEKWDFILFNLLFEKLDSEIRQRFELNANTSPCDIPTYDCLLDFLTKQCTALDSANYSFQFASAKPSLARGPINKPISKGVVTHKHSSMTSLVAHKPSTSAQCTICKGSHNIFKCFQFLNKAPHDRHILAKQHKLCLNCLSSSHATQSCVSTFSCKLCNQRHNSFLHFGNSSSNTDIVKSSNSEPTNTSYGPGTPLPRESPEDSLPKSALASSFSSASHNTVLLSTALVDILDYYDRVQTVRVLLDTGSQANFITESCFKRLGLSRMRHSVSIRGIGHESAVVSNGRTIFTIRPRGLSEPSFTLEGIILKDICVDQPSQKADNINLEHISNLPLADETFNVKGPIDILLGAELFPLILRDGRLIGNTNTPIAFNTVFGWILMGKVSCEASSPIDCLLATSHKIEEIVKSFWDVEEPPNTINISQEDLSCEQLYQNTVSRNPSGRYIVSLPFKTDNPSLGDSRSVALRRFYALERKFDRNPSLKRDYVNFMKDYLVSGYMSPAAPLADLKHSYFIPHHCILKPNAVTTKLRVVFDASAKTDIGISLNDTLFTGRKLQTDIVSLLLSFRIHKIVFTTDVKKMFLQILINPSQRNYQRIFWRDDCSQPLREFTLNTVVFGISSSPFLALRTIQQLVTDECDSFPIASKVLQSDIYVDDIITGCDSQQEALDLQQQLISLMAKGGFHLRKWASNDQSLLGNLPVDFRQMPLSFDQDAFVKILGLQWHPQADSFSYYSLPLDRLCTKRTVLSELSKIFDPLGFLTPVTFYVKRMIQYIWTLGLDWDTSPPEDIVNLWNRFTTELPSLSSLNIPRHIVPEKFNTCELHGFSDASERGYSGVVYFRFICNESYSTYLVMGKSKVAPLKQISVPRLELCAAVLLSKLIAYTSRTFRDKISFSNIYCWSDSQVALSWIKSSPHRWKTFVANRVSFIHDQTSPSFWHYVRSEDNPADCASRGILPLELLSHPLWWSGPSWLRTETLTFSTESKPVEFSSEEKTTSLTVSTETTVFDYLMERCSSLSRIKARLSWCLRFIHNIRNENKMSGKLTTTEMDSAFLMLVKYVQGEAFGEEIVKVKKKTICSKFLRHLSPFLDEHGVLRVGGRLVNSKIAFDAKFPILLPKNNRLTHLIVEEFHQTHLHPGPRTLEYLIVQQFWIISAKRVIRSIVSKCYRCFRTRPPSFTPVMGNLPASRVTQVKAFSCVGVDYGGPFFVTLGKRRGCKSQKAYLCLFICFATKALHLELASDLSSEAFLACFRRFISRRGRCSVIYSDNATNFVGAQSYILGLIRDSAESLNIEFKFNPPSGPNFGGLFEAGIKSVKTHLLRVIGDQILTYEELNTLLVQIEAMLNSRPLTSLSSDPNDLIPLTPGHFLTLEPISALPDPDLSHLKTNRMSRWQLLQNFHQTIWRRWHQEYLNTLNQRQKWHKESPPVSEGTLVIIKNDNMPPLKWRLARVIKTHLGSDGICRVVTLRTATGTLQRPVSKICPLPSQ